MFSGCSFPTSGVKNSKAAGADILVFAGAIIGADIIATATIGTGTGAITTDTMMMTTTISARCSAVLLPEQS